MAKRKKTAVRKNTPIKYDDLFDLAKSNYDGHKFQKADGYFERSLARALADRNDPQIALSYFGWAISLINQGKFLAALEQIGKANAYFGDYLDAAFLEVLAYNKESDYPNLYRACRKYLDIYRTTDPRAWPYLSSSCRDYANVLWIASDAAWKHAEFKKSLQFQKLALDEEPANHFRRIVYASNLGKDGQIEEAIDVLNDGRRRFPYEMAFENAKALIYGDAEKYDQAFEILQGILKANPRDVDALVNMGVIYEKKGDYNLAEDSFRQALAIDPRHEVAVSNITHLNEAIDRRHQKISLCMILKNEEHFLPGCLKTVAGLVDEIIVVDTGSTDRTMEIAREYGAKIYEHPWQNDFSLHRNQSIDYATGDWILILDADEEIDPAEHSLIRSAIMRKNIDAISFVVYNRIQGGRTGFLNSHRMFRSGKEYRYSGIVHNQLMMDGVALSSQFKVFHHGYGLSDEQMRAKGKRTEALLKKQLEENPDNAFAHFNLAQIYRGLGEPQLSLNHAMRVIELLGPQDIDRRHVYVMALDQIGCAYVGLDQMDKAREYFHKALEIKDDYLDPLFNLGYVYSKEGDFDRADEIFHRYLRVRNIFAEHKEWLGLILNNLNSQFAVYYGLAIAQFSRNNLDQAIDYFHKVIEQVGDFEFTHHLLARCYRAKGDFAKVLDHCRLAIDNGHKDSEVYLLQGEALLNMRDSAGAMKAFSLSLEYDKGYYPSQLGMVSAASLDGDYTKALELVDKLLANSPHTPQALAARGDLLYYAGQFGQAAQSYKDQAALSPDDPGSWNNLGNCMLRQNNLASANECYRHAIEIAPDFALGYRNLAVSNLKQDRIDEAIAYFERYLEMKSDDAEAAVTLADLYYNRKDYWKAIFNYEKYLQKNPHEHQVVLRLSDCYFNLGRLDSARMGYKAVLKLNKNSQIANRRLMELEKYNERVLAR